MYTPAFEVTSCTVEASVELVLAAEDNANIEMFRICLYLMLR